MAAILTKVFLSSRPLSIWIDSMLQEMENLFLSQPNSLRGIKQTPYTTDIKNYFKA